MRSSSRSLFSSRIPTKCARTCAFYNHRISHLTYTYISLVFIASTSRFGAKEGRFLPILLPHFCGAHVPVVHMKDLKHKEIPIDIHRSWGFLQSFCAHAWYASCTPAANIYIPGASLSRPHLNGKKHVLLLGLNSTVPSCEVVPSTRDSSGASNARLSQMEKPYSSTIHDGKGDSCI